MNTYKYSKPFSISWVGIEFAYEQRSLVRLPLTAGDDAPSPRRNVVTMASVGRATFLLYFLSTLFAVCEALVLAAALRPGKGAALGGGDHACFNQTTGYKRDGASLPEGLNPTSAFLGAYALFGTMNLGLFRSDVRRMLSF